MRLENSIKNIKTAWIFQLVHIMCQFLSRTIIIKVLAIEYVGLSGLFGNVLMMLSLAELGIGEAIIFSLYKPIAKKEEGNIKSIMSFYKKIYIGVGIFILVAGLLITPYIGYFIKDMPEITGLYTIYMLYVVNSSVSYFFSYKSAFITANQSNYIVALNKGVWEIAMVAIQVSVLIATKNYIAYMIIGICFIVLQNISINLIANKRYPYLKEKSNDKMPKEIVGQIKKNTGAMVFHKIGTIIVFATDNLILSKFVGLISVGIYANYCTIINAVTLFINKFFLSISASVGHLVVEEDIDVQEKTFFKVLFTNFWLYMFAGSCLMALLNPFIGEVWLGQDFLFSNWIVLLIVIKIYISGMRGAVQTFKNAKGLYWQNRYMPVYESLINLGASLLLVNYIGVSGVLLGTIISSLSTCVWIEPYVLYKHGFKKSPKTLYIQYVKYFLVFIVAMGMTFGITNLIQDGGIIIFLIRGIISLVVPNLIFFILYKNKEEFKYLKSVVAKKLKGNRA